jgi:hypothetical protein
MSDTSKRARDASDLARFFGVQSLEDFVLSSESLASRMDFADFLSEPRVEQDSYQSWLEEEARDIRKELRAEARLDRERSV